MTNQVDVDGVMKKVVRQSKVLGIAVEDPAKFRELDTFMYMKLAELVKEVLGANASFKNVDVRVYPDSITVYAGAVSNVLVRVFRGRAADIGTGQLVWRHSSIVSRKHIEKALVENGKTRQYFTWPTWAYSVKKG